MWNILDKNKNKTSEQKVEEPQGERPLGAGGAAWKNLMNGGADAPSTVAGEETRGSERTGEGANTATSVATSVATPEYVPTDEGDRGTLAYLQQLMGDPEEEKRRERANKTRLGILAVGDAMRHIGNIYHTTKDSPSQQFDRPVKEEWERQETEDAKLKAQRMKASQMLQAYQKQQSDIYFKNQDLKLKAEKAEREKEKAAREAEEHTWKGRDYEDKHNQSEARTGYINKQTEYLGEKSKREDELNGARIEHMKNQDAVARENAKTAKGRLALGWASLEERRSYHNNSSWKNTRKKASSGGGRTRVSNGSGGSKYVHVTPLGKVYAFPKEPNKKQVAELYNRLASNYKSIRRATTEDEQWTQIMRFANDPVVESYFDAWGGELDEVFDPVTGESLGDEVDFNDFGVE